MLRVLYCTDFLSASGVERQLTELLTRLDGVDAEVICLYADKWGRDLHFAPRLKNIPLHVLDLGHRDVAKLRGVLAIIRHTWRFRPHIVHAVNYHSNLLTRLARPFLPPRTRLIGTVRVEYTPKQLRYERWSHRLCWRIVCNSPHLHQQLSAHIPARRLVMIPNGVDLARFSPSEVRHERGDQRIFLMMGRISAQKAQCLVMEALQLMKSSGRISPALRVYLVGYVEDLSVQAKIDAAMADLEQIVSQYPATDEPETYYWDAAVTLLPSLYEGMPNVVLESLAAGRPIILSEKANAAGIITNGVEGWVVRTGDVAHLADTMTKVAAVPAAQLATMGAACQQRAADFAMEHMVQRYRKLYAEGKVI